MKGQKACYQTKRGCPMRTSVGLDRVSIVPLDQSMDETRAVKKNSKKGLGVSCFKDECEPV